MVLVLSKGGFVFGIQHMVVNPPLAAARDPVKIVSFSSKPGCLRWQ